MVHSETLKPGWTKVKFGEVVRLCKDRSSDPEADGIERYVGLEHLEPEDLRIRSWGLVADGTTFTSRFKPGQVLFGKRRAYQRKVAVADFEGVCSGDIYIFESADPKRLLPELLPFICQTDQFFEYAIKTSAGSLSPRTNWKTLADFELRLPSLRDQILISNRLLKLNQYLISLENVLEKTNNVIIPLIRNFSGIRNSSDESNFIKNEINFTNAGWQISRIKELCSKERNGVQVGPFGGSVSSKYFTKQGIPILKINNIPESGVLNLSDLVSLTREQGEKLSEKYSLQTGDIVITAQATIGRIAVVPPNANGFIMSQHLIRVSVDNQKCLPDWLYLCLKTPFVSRQIWSFVQGGTRNGLNTNHVQNLKVPLPPLKEQITFLAKIKSINEVFSKGQIRIVQTRRIIKTLLEEVGNEF